MTTGHFDRLALLFWLCVLGAAAFLAVDTAIAIWRIGLIGARPPLSLFHTGLRIAVVVAALGLMSVRRGLFERVTLLTGVAAAGSSALYGFGLRSDGLSAFRLLSHLVVYVLATILAGHTIFRRRNAD